jgi:hypothetical protein
MTTTTNQRDVFNFAFELSRQLIAIAIGSIGFLLGVLYTSESTVISPIFFWSILIAFGLSVIAGLFFFMRGVGLLSNSDNYTIYEKWLRLSSFIQILSLLIGIILLCFNLQIPIKDVSETIQLKNNGKIVNYPIRPNEKYTIEIDDNYLKFTTE